MATKHQCAIKGCLVTANECASISLDTDHVGFAKCLACPRGQDVAKASNWKHAKPVDPELAVMLAKGEEQADATASQAVQETSAETPAEQPPQDQPAPPRSARVMVRQALGCTSDRTVAKKLRCSQPAVSSAFRTLEAGETPRGSVYETILRVSGFSTEELLRPANMGQADHIGDATEMAQPAPASKIVHGDKLPPTMMGTDPVDALINTEEAQVAPTGVTVELTLEMAGDINPGGYGAAVPGLFFVGDKADIITATRIAFGRPCRVTFEPLPERPRQQQAKLGV